MGCKAAGWAERSGLWSRKMSDRVQVVLWREMGETTSSSVGLGDHPAGLGFAVLCCASLRCCCCCCAWEDPGRLEAGAATSDVHGCSGPGVLGYPCVFLGRPTARWARHRPDQTRPAAEGEERAGGGLGRLAGWQAGRAAGWALKVRMTSQHQGQRAGGWAPQGPHRSCT